MMLSTKDIRLQGRDNLIDINPHLTDNPLLVVIPLFETNITITNAPHSIKQIMDFLASTGIEMISLFMGNLLLIQIFPMIEVTPQSRDIQRVMITKPQRDQMVLIRKI